MVWVMVWGYMAEEGVFVVLDFGMMGSGCLGLVLTGLWKGV